MWPGDDDPRSAHFAVLAAGEAVAVASVVPEEPGLRLRGMATAPEHRGRGHGATLVQACVRHAREAGAPRVWCAARVGAVALYERAGFVREGGVFVVPDLGPHVRLALELRPAARDPAA